MADWIVDVLAILWVSVRERLASKSQVTLGFGVILETAVAASAGRGRKCADTGFVGHTH